MTYGNIIQKTSDTYRTGEHANCARNDESNQLTPSMTAMKWSMIAG
jgi:hypothetical protein